MNRRRAQLVAVLGLILCATFTAARAAEPVIWAQTLDEAWELAREHDRPMLVYITKNGCPYCTKMKNITYADGNVAREVNNHYVPVMVSPATGKELISKLKIRSYPTTLVISPDYSLTDRITGYIPPTEMQRRLTRAAAYVASKPDSKVR